MYHLFKKLEKISSIAVCVSLLGVGYTSAAFGMEVGSFRDECWRAAGYTRGPEEMSMEDIQAAIDAMEGRTPVQRPVAINPMHQGDDLPLDQALAMIAMLEGREPEQEQEGCHAAAAGFGAATEEDDVPTYAESYDAVADIASTVSRITKVYNGHRLATDAITAGFKQEALPLIMRLQNAEVLQDPDLGPRARRIRALEKQLETQEGLLDMAEVDGERSTIQAKIAQLRVGIESLQNSLYGSSAEEADASRTFFHINGMHLPAALRRLMDEIRLVGAPEALLLAVKENLPGFERTTFETLWQVAESLPHSAKSNRIRTVLPTWEE